MAKPHVATSTYGYDDTDARVWLKEGNTKTIFPNALYNVVLGTTTSTSTKHIMVGDLLVATVENVGTTTTSTTTPVISKRFAVTDHLGSVTAMLTASGTLAETLDAFPYGGMRLDNKVGSYIGEKNKYAQTQYDATANLNYAQARYQDPTRGQFISEDPVFWTSMNIADPQSLNSYSYANDNPVTKSDPTGRCIEDGCVGEATALGAFVGGTVGFGYQYASDVTTNIQQGGLRPSAFFTGLSSPKQYALSTGKGAVVGGATALASIYELGVIGVGLASGASTALTDAGSNAVMHKQMGWSDAGDIAFNTVTGGFGEYLPGIPGRLPGVFSQAFFTGSHAQSSFAQSLAGAGVQLAMANAGPITSLGQLNNLKSALQSLNAVLSSLQSSAGSSQTKQK
jgi:RHS repeat-associated protein